MLVLALITSLSIDNQLFAADGDSFDYHYEKSRTIFSDNIDDAIFHALEASKIAFELRDKELIGKAHWMTGWLYRRKGDLVNSFNYYAGARKAYFKLRDWDKVEQLEENLGSVAFDNRSFKIAIYRWEQRLKTSMKLGEERVANAHFDLGLAKMKDGQLVEAYKHHLQSLTYYTVNYKPQHDEKIARIYNELGLVYFNMAIVDLSIAYSDSSKLQFHKALDFDDSSLMSSMVSQNLGRVEHLLKNYPIAEDHYRKAMISNTNNGRERLLITNLLKLGELFYDLNMPDSSMVYLSQVIYKEYSSPVNNHIDLENETKIDLTDELIHAVSLIDSIHASTPRIVSESNYLLVLETVSKIKMNMLFMEKVHSTDLIELADKEMQAELNEKIWWTKFWNWVLVSISVLAIAYSIVRSILWLLKKRAIAKEIQESKKRAEGVLNK